MVSLAGRIGDIFIPPDAQGFVAGALIIFDANGVDTGAHRKKAIGHIIIAVAPTIQHKLIIEIDAYTVIGNGAKDIGGIIKAKLSNPARRPLISYLIVPAGAS